MPFLTSGLKAFPPPPRKSFRLSNVEGIATACVDHLKTACSCRDANLASERGTAAQQWLAFEGQWAFVHLHPIATYHLQGLRAQGASYCERLAATTKGVDRPVLRLCSTACCSSKDRSLDHRGGADFQSGACRAAHAEALANSGGSLKTADDRAWARHLHHFMTI